MSRIVSPFPNVITITIDEKTGKIDMNNSREIPFHRLIAVFAQLSLNLALQMPASPGIGFREVVTVMFRFLMAAAADMEKQLLGQGQPPPGGGPIPPGQQEGFNNGKP